MLEYDDIQNLKESLDRLQIILDSIEGRKSFYEGKVELLDFNKIKGLEIKNLVAEDSGYVTGNLGSLSYIYVKSCAISKNSKVKSSNIYLSDENFVGFLKISSVAEVLGKLHEYFNVFRILKKEKPDVILFDGSLVSDIILTSSYFSQVIDRSEREKFLDEIKSEENPEEYSEVLKISYLSEKYIKVISVILPILIRSIIRYCLENNIFVFYFTKRPGASFLAKKLNFEYNDPVLLSTIFGKSEFYTNWYRIDFSEIPYEKLYGDLIHGFLIMYYRGVPRGHIYRVETVDSYDKNEITQILKSVLFNESDIERYPKMLALAHFLSNISLEDKSFIENVLIKKLGKFGSKEITRYI